MKDCNDLSIEDYDLSPVWEFINDDEIGELKVRPFQNFPIESFNNKLLISKITLSNSTQLWALVSNIELEKIEYNQHFLSLSIENNKEWFHLARYHDIDYERSGPPKLAEFLKMKVEEIFPIKIEIDSRITGGSKPFVILMPIQPEKKFTRTEIIQMAVNS